VHSQAAAAQVKKFGKANDLIERLKNDAAFAKVDFKKVLNAGNYIGRAPQQVDEFTAKTAAAALKKYRGKLNKKTILKV
jgi:adenylosuccinate lyase